METTPLGYLYGLLLTAGGLGLASLMAWGSLYLAARWKDTKLGTFGLELYDLARSIVAHLEAEMRPTLNEAFRDGKLSKEEAATLKKKAMELLYAQLGEQGLEKLKKLKGLGGPMVEVFLSGLIERAVVTQKVLAAPVPSKPLP